LWEVWDYLAATIGSLLSGTFVLPFDGVFSFHCLSWEAMDGLGTVCHFSFSYISVVFCHLDASSMIPDAALLFVSSEYSLLYAT
jgi:hypothetical protein